LLDLSLACFKIEYGKLNSPVSNFSPLFKAEAIRNFFAALFLASIGMIYIDALCLISI
jgi:hypothetical protein